jgi:hypothetical protein
LKDIDQFVGQITDFSNKSAPFIIEAFAWYLHEVKQQDRLTSSHIGACFDAAHIPRPANIGSSLAKLCAKKPARLLKDSKGYRLTNAARSELGVLLPVRATTVKTTNVLNDLLSRVSDPAQKTFLGEALICYKYHAYRAAVVMAWNLAFSDVLDRILANHLVAFNGQIGTHGFKRAIGQRSDFEDLKEGQIITLARNAHILSKESVKTLEEKLNKRNTAAHPSTVVVSSATAEEVIFDLVENIILKQTL